MLPPRIVIAGTHSGVGKTTVATGLMAALRARGLEVGAAKVGPDFIDPGYHALAAGRPSRNLDIWMSGADAVVPIAARAGAGCDLLVIEGVMGLFDGAGDGTPSSTADVAALLDAPIVLVVDAAAMSQSIAALVSGYANFDRRLDVRGVILNRVGSPGHETMLREALAPLELPVVGCLPRDDRLVWRDRHLGLVPVVEQPGQIAAALQRLATLVDRRCDLTEIERIARGVAPIPARELATPRHVGWARIAVAGGRAFSFLYPDNLEALGATGAELVVFDPTTDTALPERVDALIAGGGFPEMYAAELAANRPLLDDVAGRARDGLVIWAECGGMLWLADQLDHTRMGGIVPTAATMSDRLTLGYRTATTLVDSPLGVTGTVIRGHEFHYSTCEPAGDALELVGRHGVGVAGFASRRLLASYLHTHLAARPDLTEQFVATALHLPYIG